MTKSKGGCKEKIKRGVFQVNLVNNHTMERLQQQKNSADLVENLLNTKNGRDYCSNQVSVAKLWGLHVAL